MRAYKGHSLEGAESGAYKAGDGPLAVLHGTSHSKLLLYSSAGRCYTLAGDKIPRSKQGDPVRLFVDMEAHEELHSVMVYTPTDAVLIVLASGRGFRMAMEAAYAQTKAGKQVVDIPAGDRLHACLPIAASHTHVAMLGQGRKLLCIPLEEIPIRKSGQGVVLQKYPVGGTLATLWLCALRERYLEGLPTAPTRDCRPWLGKRGGTGARAPQDITIATA
jgi:topoisomerase-4 subunit A